MLFLAACTASDPWTGAPVPPPGVTAETWAVSLHGRLVGVEQRWRTGERAVRRRTLTVLADGETHEVRSAWAFTLLPDGRAGSWTWWEPGASGTGEGPAWVPDVTPPPASGVWPLL